MQIENKAQMYELYHAGKFGNRLRTWKGMESLLNSDYRGSVTLRYAGGKGGKFNAYSVSIASVPEKLAEFVRQGADYHLFTANESAPDAHLVIQGEVQRTPLGLTLRYSAAKLKMRDAMDFPLYANGLSAKLRLQRYMTPSDWEDMNDLLDAYDGGIVEFSVFDHELGDCPHRRTIFWEVRHY